VPGAVFCGDTLFAGGCGRVFSEPVAPDGEIPPGHRRMFASLMRLAELPGDTRVCCAHEYTLDNLRFAWSVEPGNRALAERIARTWPLRAEGFSVVPSTIADEQATNPFLRPGSPEIVSGLPVGERQTPLAVFTALRTLKDRGAYKQLPEPGVVR
jgi:hydroxyacylglutathione hydrolase